MGLFAKAMIVAIPVLGLLAAAPVATMYLTQDEYLFPVRHSGDPVLPGGIWQRDTLDLPGAGRIAFRFADVGGAPTAPVLLFLHGNGSSARLASGDVQALAEAGIPVLAAEYPGYSDNPGAPSEASLNATAEASAAWARARWPGRRLAVLGESIGSAPAVHLATTGRADLLILDSGFTSMTETIRLHVPWLPAVQWLNRHPMDNLGRLRAAPKPLPPTLVLLFASDPVVPVAMGEALAAVIPCSTVYRSALTGHAVLRGDPAARQVLRRWLLEAHDRACATAAPAG